jgi:large subunit ribosomal protein L13
MKEKIIEIDAQNRSLGRVSTEVVRILTGKDDPSYQPNVLGLNNNFKIKILNIDRAKFTGKKLDGKIYYGSSGYLGSVKQKSLREMYQENPQKLFLKILKGMLPKNNLRDQLLKKVIFS